MKKIILSTAIAAFMLPAAAFAQETQTPATGATGTMQTEGAMGTTEGGAMGTMESGAMSSTSDTTGNYTIITQSSADVAAGSSSDETTNRNTDPAAVQSTIDANPGLAEKLEAEGLTMDRIAAISVGTNGQVTVYTQN